MLRKVTILLCLLSAFSACSQIDDNADGNNKAAIITEGDLLPAFTLSGSDGSQVTSASLNGRVFILNFFDTRCPDCQQEFRVLQQIYDHYATTVPILNVPRSQSRDEVAAYWKEAELTMPFYIPDEKDLYYQFASSTIPRTYVVGADGRVAAAFDDSPIADHQTLDALLQQLKDC
ncbi:MAG: TlpA family protein disulfide reductase [Prevotella sp.]|nr:TlpA family protein disulfide reductase [Prevotella sp.]